VKARGLCEQKQDEDCEAKVRRRRGGKVEAKKEKGKKDLRVQVTNIEENIFKGN